MSDHKRTNPCGFKVAGRINGVVYTAERPHRHNEIYQVMIRDMGRELYDELRRVHGVETGFVLKGTYYTRSEAARMHRNAGGKCNYTGGAELFSEDLF